MDHTAGIEHRVLSHAVRSLVPISAELIILLFKTNQQTRAVPDESECRFFSTGSYIFKAIGGIEGIDLYDTCIQRSSPYLNHHTKVHPIFLVTFQTKAGNDSLCSRFLPTLTSDASWKCSNEPLHYPVRLP